MRIEVESAVYGGQCIGRTKEGVLLITGAIPGETVEVERVEERKGTRHAVVSRVVTASPDRIEPRCPVFGRCGGCHFQFIDYPRQLRIKQEAVVDCLKRIGKIGIELDAPLSSRPWQYRKRALVKAGRGGTLGFFAAQSHDVVGFEHCLLLVPELDEFIGRARRAGPALAGGELLVQSGEDPPSLVACVRGAVASREEAASLLEAAGARAVVFDGRRSGTAPRTRLRADGFEYHVSAGTFFQANWDLNRKLLGLVAGEADRVRPVSVVDLYAGAGNFSLAAAPFAKRVVAVEESAAACRDGEHNARKNGFRNVTFVETAVADFCMPQGADLLVLDPPRAGLSGGVVRGILRAAPGLILYVSCNPATFARDAGALGSRYALRSLRVVDMFPQTCHMEVLGVLDLLGGRRQ